MDGIETITLDAPEFIDFREELNLDELGLRVRDSEWGDAEQEVFLIRQEFGEIPADRHPPNRQVTLKLRVATEGTVSLAEAAYKLQQKVGTLQREGGWVKRTMTTDSGFKYSVGFEVHKAVLGGLHGWMMAHRDTAPEVTLVMEVSPYCYADTEIEGEEIIQEADREIEYKIEKAPGTAPGKLRIRVKNLGATDWLGLIHDVEQVDERTATNRLVYQAEAMTPLGTAVEAAKTGASNGKVIKAGVSTFGGQQAVLESKIKATGLDLTHIGGRRLLTRLYNTSSTAENMYVFVEWRALSGEWEKNDPVTVEVAPGWNIVDLGEAIAEQAQLGEQVWQFRVIIGANKVYSDYLEFDKFYILTQRQYMRLRKGVSVNIPTGYKIDGQPSPVGIAGEALNGKLMTTGGGKYETSGSAKGDFVLSGTSELFSAKIIRSQKEDLEPRKALISAPLLKDGILAIGLQMYYWYTALEGTGHQHTFQMFMQGGAVEAGVALYKESSGSTRIRTWIAGTNVEVAVFVENTIFSESGLFWPTLYLGCIGSKAFFWTGSPFKNEPTIIADLKSSAEGKVGFGDYSPKKLNQETDIMSIAAWVPDSDTLVHAGKYLDVSTDGSFRQDKEKDVWGYVPLDEGFHPRLHPSGLEERTIQGLVLPSLGDLEKYSDAGTPKLSSKSFYRPAYHFASEAA